MNLIPREPYYRFPRGEKPVKQSGVRLEPQRDLVFPGGISSEKASSEDSARNAGRKFLGPTETSISEAGSSGGSVQRKQAKEAPLSFAKTIWKENGASLEHSRLVEAGDSRPQ
jgi:hypothetical protein